MNSLQQSRSLWIGDIEPWMDENHLTQILAPISPLVSVKLIKDKNTGQNMGYGFLEFQTHQAAQSILMNYNGNLMPNSSKPFKMNWGQHQKQQMAVQPIQMSQQQKETSIYVCDLDVTTNEAEVVQFFKMRYRSASAAKLIQDPQTGMNKGYGFVKFTSQDEAQRAIKEMNGQIFKSRIIKVSSSYQKNQVQQMQQGQFLQQPFINQNSPLQQQNRIPQMQQQQMFSLNQLQNLQIPKLDQFNQFNNIQYQQQQQQQNNLQNILLKTPQLDQLQQQNLDFQMGQQQQNFDLQMGQQNSDLQMGQNQFNNQNIQQFGENMSQNLNNMGQNQQFNNGNIQQFNNGKNLQNNKGVQNFQQLQMPYQQTQQNFLDQGQAQNQNIQSIQNINELIAPNNGVYVVGIQNKDEHQQNDWTFNLNTELQKQIFQVEKISLDENVQFINKQQSFIQFQEELVNSIS